VTDSLAYHIDYKITALKRFRVHPSRESWRGL